jgi:hypothetical protein
MSQTSERPGAADSGPIRSQLLTGARISASPRLQGGTVTAYDRVLDHLRDNAKTVREGRAGQAIAQCPAHDDRNPSLSIRQIEGQALIYCHAGCDSRDVLKALGLTMGDLFDDPKGATYRYEDGRLVHRTPDKQFKQSGNTKGTAQLYRAAAVAAAVRNGTVITVVEGEKDVHALESLGVVATTAPMGAANWSKVDPSPLYGGKIVIIPDGDEAGQRWAQAVRASLDGKVESLWFMGPKVGKDAADHVAAGHTLAELVPWHPPEADEPNPLLAGLRTGDWLDAQIFPPLNYVVPGLIPEGLTLLVGAPKIGKSWLSLSIALAAASGARALGHIEVDPRPVLLLALEDGDRRLQDRIRKLIPGPIPPQLHYMTRIKPGMVVPTIEAWLATVDHPEPFVLLDTVGKILPPAMNGETTYQRDYKVAGRLKEICDNRPGMALTGLHHDRKAAAEDFVESVSGTNGLAGAADTIIVISRPRNESQGLLKVTGRDVVEAEYAVTTMDGNWLLMGGSLEDAASIAATIRATANLGDRSAEILRYVNKHPEGVRAGDVAKALGDLDAQKAGTYLGRLHNSGKVRKLERGLYTPVESVESVETETLPLAEGDNE